MFGDLFSDGGGGFDGPDLSQFGGGFDAMFVIVPVIIGLGFVAIVVTIVLRSARMAKRGQNPFTIEEDLAYQAMQSRTLAPEKSLEQRLAELDDLHARGVISDEEHRVARAEALRA